MEAVEERVVGAVEEPELGVPVVAAEVSEAGEAAARVQAGDLEDREELEEPEESAGWVGERSSPGSG